MQDADEPQSTLSSSVGVIIVNFNTTHLLAQCMKSLQSQTLPPRRVLIVDNGSHHESRHLLEKIAGSTEIVFTEKNLGFAAANNLGIAMMEDCEWVALLNPDAFPSPQWLTELVYASHRHPDFTFFASRLVQAQNTKLLDGAGDQYHISGMARRHLNGRPVSSDDNYVREVFGPCAAAALYRRDAFLNVGGFDESYFCYFEDVDLSFRLRLAGHRCLYVPGAVVSHLGSASTGQHSEFATYHGHRNMVTTFFKNMPWPLLGLYLPQHILVNLLAVFWLGVKRGQGRLVAKAKWDALRLLGDTMRKRRKSMALRKIRSSRLLLAMNHGFWRPQNNVRLKDH